MTRVVVTHRPELFRDGVDEAGGAARLLELLPGGRWRWGGQAWRPDRVRR